MSDHLRVDPLFLIYDVARLMRTRADRRARKRGMTRAQWVVLAWLELKPGISQVELAELVEVEPITVARLIDRLENCGLVERRADPKDRRVRRLVLTEKAAPLLEEIRQYRAELLETISAGLPPGAMEAMSDALLTIKSNLARDIASPVEQAV
jgi:DNA-binding MarR family transcriptional regulator